jgi:hypothetical protein
MNLRDIIALIVSLVVVSQKGLWNVKLDFVAVKTTKGIKSLFFGKLL